ncbi:DUF460 domain-containing protein [Candidatus Nanohalobium constans]|uniref:Putative nuclease of RNase H fold, RuvC/YqgF family n=1 Tax=Candidatus Nanohalobium constans TaxID=2565781 RepID=A0A5Q0UI00_9ARCH|nr:DUF460 domain-containing protein [Candidatus Nanohalobium constans]QGA80555.1 putative nuclease of RNase H fold, RuvC/YqgF family [Candidatus Nanohalobium constans]
MAKKPLIVGVDPGSTSAVAAVTLDGEVELLESGKNFPPREIIQRLIKVGKPVVVASDKGKTPSKVDKISSSLGAKTFEPEEDLSQDRKKRLGKGANSHELDALASAVHAQKQLHKEIRKINKLKSQLNRDKIEVAEKVFEGEPVRKSEDATPEEPDEYGEAGEASGSGDDVDPEKKRLEKKVENLEEQVQRLKSELGEERSEKESLRAKLSRLRDEERKEVRKEEEVQKREAEIKRKNQEIEELEEEISDYRIREKQYRKAVRKIFHEDRDLVRVVDKSVEEVPEKAVTRNKDLIEVLENRGCNIYHVDRVEGVELSDFYLVESFPEPKNFESIIEDYKDSR